MEYPPAARKPRRKAPKPKPKKRSDGDKTLNALIRQMRKVVGKPTRG